MIPIAKPFVGAEEKEAVARVLESGMLAQGENVKEFEKAFAEFIGVKHAIATSNGTTALHAALLAHGITKGDEVITTPFTFIATANSIRMAGAVPVFVDIDEKTYNLNPELIEAAITQRTRAIIPVHLFGQSCEMGRIVEIAQKHNLMIIEDACQAHGASYNGRKVGSFGTGCFSFYPTKNMTSGEGGMITTNDDKIAEKARKVISHGEEKRYYHDILGYNFRMTNIAAAIGVCQLQKLLQFNAQRKRNAAFLRNELSKIPGLIAPETVTDHVFHQFTIRITPNFSKNRDEVLELLKLKGIGTSVFYPVPIHKQKAYPEYNQQHFPVAEKIAQEVLSLPVHPGVCEEDCQIIVNAVREIYEMKKNGQF